MLVKPLLIYDGECKFCCHWVSRWKHITGKRVEYAPFQQVGGRYPEISEKQFKKSVQLIGSKQRVTDGAKAVLQVLNYKPRNRLPLWLYENFPGVAPVCEWSYRWVVMDFGN